jgi:hypothetical protein
MVRILSEISIALNRAELPAIVSKRCSSNGAAFAYVNAVTTATMPAKSEFVPRVVAAVGVRRMR